MRSTPKVILSAGFVAAACMGHFAWPGEAGYRVIVNTANTTGSIDKNTLSDIFLKRDTHWQNGKKILPVDLIPDSRVRSEFSEDILNRAVAAVRIYWHQLLFSGRDVPPPELKSDKEVIDYVVLHEEAVGYVSKDADIHKVKVLQVR